MTLRHDLVPGGDTEALNMAGQLPVAFHDWTFLIGAKLCAGFGNGPLLGYLM